MAVIRQQADLDFGGVSRIIRAVLNPVTTDPASPVNGEVWYNSTEGVLKARQGGVTVPWGAGGGEAPEGVATVYVHDGNSYELVGGRIFVGPEDPVADGFTLADGDQWVDPS